MAKKAAGNGQLYVGVDLGGTKILAAVVDAAGGVRSRAKKKTNSGEGVEGVVDRMSRAVEAALQQAGLTPADVTALGVGACGPVDFEKGVVVTAGNMPWTNVPLQAMLRKSLGIRRVVIDNDTNAGTYGEWKHGAGRGCDSLVGIFVGTGIGAGLVLDGRLYRGRFHTAGEIGHTIINSGGNMTGRSLEDLGSRGAIGVIISRSIATNHPSIISRLVSPEELFTGIRSKALAQAFAESDPVTVQCLEQAARYIGTAAANAATLLSLQRVVIGGGLQEALGEPLVRMIESQLRADVFPATLPVEIVASSLQDDAVVVGAALLARDTAA